MSRNCANLSRIVADFLPTSQMIASLFDTLQGDGDGDEHDGGYGADGGLA